MHPSEFFENCSLRTGIDVFEIYDTDLKEKLKKENSCKSVMTETEGYIREKQVKDIIAAIKRYNSMLPTSDSRRIDECKTVNDEYIYEFVR